MEAVAGARVSMAQVGAEAFGAATAAGASVSMAQAGAEAFGAVATGALAVAEALEVVAGTMKAPRKKSSVPSLPPSSAISVSLLFPFPFLLGFCNISSTLVRLAAWDRQCMHI